MNRPKIYRLLLTSVCVVASPLVSAAGSNCSAMEASGPKWFAAQLDEVRSTYRGGDSQGAYAQLRTAMSHLPRLADVSLNARCVGPAGWQRLNQLRSTITHSLGKQAESAGQLASTGGALDWYVIGDNREDARRVINRLTPTASGAAFIIYRLRSEIGSLDHALESGFELLPDERLARAFWQQQLDDAIAFARRQGAGLLEKEAGLLTSADTTSEEQLEQAQEEQRTLITGLLGDESLAVQNEALREVNRARVSLKMLGDARSWLQPVSPADAEPVRDRAMVRGDALLARGSDPNLSLEARDSLFETADQYFEFAGNTQRRQAAAQSRAAIAPALQAERDARAARIEQKKTEIQKSAQETIQSLQKSDAQKHRFKEEADAIEGALGF